MKKIGFIAMALVLALGALGVGFAHWADTLIITETVNTGEVKVGIRDIGTNDNGVPEIAGWDDEDDDRAPQEYDAWGADSLADPSACGDNPTRYNKDVAKTISENPTQDVHFQYEGKDYYLSCSDTIYNAYPSYYASMKWEVVNAGTIPVKLHIVSFVDGDSPLAPFVDTPFWKITLNGDTVSNGTGTYWTSLSNCLEGLQFHPDDVLVVELCKHILQNQGEVLCPENASVTYVLTVDAVQWNKYSPTGEY